MKWKNEKNRSSAAMLFILVTIVCCPMVELGIMCNDELLLRLWAQHGLLYLLKAKIFWLAVPQGRVLSLALPGNLLSNISDNKYIFKTIDVLFLLAAIGLMGYFAYRLFGQIRFSILLSILLLVFLPITFELVAPNAHTITCTQPLILLELSLIFFLDYTDRRRRKSMAACIGMFLWAMFLYEFVVTYVLLFPMLYIIRNLHGKNRIRDSLKTAMPLALSAAGYLILYMMQRMAFPSNYTGNQFGIHSVRELFGVLEKLFLSALPGYYLFDEKHRYLFRLYHAGGISLENLYHPATIVFSIALLFLLGHLTAGCSEKKNISGKDILIMLTAFFYTFFPALPNALTAMYQEAFAKGKFRSIPVSLFLYFSVMFLLTYMGWKLVPYLNVRKRKAVCLLLVVTAACGVQIENRVFAGVHAGNYERLECIEDLLALSYWKQFGELTVQAPSFYETRNMLVVEPGHWTDYAHLHGNELEVAADGDTGGNVYLEMQDDHSFYFYWDGMDVLITKEMIETNERKDTMERKLCLRDADGNYKQAAVAVCLEKEAGYFIYALRLSDHSPGI